MSCNLKEYKEFLDNEMLLILGQMDKATLIFDHVYLVRIFLCFRSLCYLYMFPYHTLPAHTHTHTLWFVYLAAFSFCLFASVGL